MLSIDIMRTVYNALYKSNLQYGLIVWGGCVDSAMMPLITKLK